MVSLFILREILVDEKVWELRIKKLEFENHIFYNKTILLELVYPHVEVELHRIGKFGITHDNMQKM